jgi:hypothetical protein
MMQRSISLSVFFLTILACSSGMAAATDLSLRGAVVVVDATEPSYVHYAVEELRRQVKSVTGEAPELSYELNSGSSAARVLVVVGRSMADRLGSSNPSVPRITDEKPGAQGFVLSTVQLVGDHPGVIAAGSDASGTNYALMQLRQLLIESTSGVSIPASLNIQDKPKYAVRGLYLHQHWRYNNPYATWSWSVQDWKHAIDLVAYMRINLVMFWPHMDMLAPPLTPAERDRLADLREVIDYAHRERNIKVWLIEAPNVLLDSKEAKALPLEGRDYYAFHYKGKGLKNPGDPHDFEAMMANRTALYRDVPNADGYGYLDSDPGGWDGSPSSAFVDLLVGNRKLLNQYHQNPSEAALLYWVWASWGTGTVEENWRNAMADFQNRVTPPRQFLLGWAPHVTIAREQGVLGESIFFPYGVIEGEPTFPLTSINFAAINRSLNFASAQKGLHGVMANAQTLFVQIPNLYHFFSVAWNGANPDSDRTSLSSLARLLLPDHSELLADGWAQLKGVDADVALSTAGKLEALAHDTEAGRVGTLGEFVFPDHMLIVRDLATMLRVHAGALRVKEQAESGRPATDLSKALNTYFREMLDWQKSNGFFGAYGVDKKIVFDNYIYDEDAQMVRSAWQKGVRDAKERKSLEAEVTNRLLAAGYKESVVRAMTGQLFGTARVGEGDENPVFKKLPSQKELRPWANP